MPLDVTVITSEHIVDIEALLDLVQHTLDEVFVLLVFQDVGIPPEELLPILALHHAPDSLLTIHRRRVTRL